MRIVEPIFMADPTPGDPAGVAELIRYLGEVAVGMRTASDVMKQLDCETIWDSDAAEAFKEQQDELPPDMDTVAERYEQVAVHLAVWETGLRDIQARMNDACEEYRAARLAYVLEDGDMGTAMLEGDADEVARLQRIDERHTHARDECFRIKDQYDELAGELWHKIGGVIEDGLNNQWWQSAIEVGGELLGKASGWLGLASIMFPPLAPIAFATGAVGLGMDHGVDGKSLDGWDVLSLLPLGLGRVGAAGRVGTRTGVRIATGAGVIRRRIAEVRLEKPEKPLQISRESDAAFKRRLQGWRDALQEWNVTNSGLHQNAYNMEAQRFNAMLRDVRADQRAFWTQWRHARNWRPNVKDYYKPWNKDDPNFAKVMGAIEVSANLVGTGLDLRTVSGIQGPSIRPDPFPPGPLPPRRRTPGPKFPDPIPPGPFPPRR